jgi:pimeloyl-ACP methyl ester carboxylesterase
VETGTGAPIVLLHGIPESWRAWERFLGPLEEAGHRVVAADLRGYNLSDKPRNARAYRGTLLAEDVVAMIRATGSDRASVVGHSWGALSAWLFAMRYPEMLNRLVILNVPHPQRWVRALHSWRWLRRNPQILFFQLPVVPEWLLGAFHQRALRRALERDLGGSESVDAGTIDRYVSALSEPGALTGALNYYRAFLRENPWRLGWEMSVIEAPVLVIWGDQDKFFSPEMAAPPAELVPNARVEIVEGARHWTHHDRPDVVTKLLVDFLGRA